MIFCVLLLIPLIVAVVSFVALDGITWKEFLAQAGVQIVVAGFSALIVSCANTYDVEVWSGTVTKKSQDWVPCSHSYQCHCHEVCTGSGKNKSCNEECDTCYEHLNDWDWDVYTSNGESLEIDRVDRRGSDEPPRWTAVRLGEPTALTHGYTSYIKAAPDTLFRHQGLVEQYKDRLPTYPQKVYDYYRLNRLVTMGVITGEDAQWNEDLSRINGELGLQKQANMIVVLVHHMPQDWYYALEEAWLGGKKNDVILVVSVDDDMKPEWATVMAWTTSELLKVKLRDDVMALPHIRREATIPILHDDVSALYVRKPMKDFQYLEASIVPSTTEWVISILFGLLVAGGLTYLFQTEQVLDGEAPGWFALFKRKRKKKNGGVRRPRTPGATYGGVSGEEEGEDDREP